MSFTEKKKELITNEQSKRKISEKNEESFTESERRKEEKNNLEEMDVMSAMDDSFSESFYKEILEDSENEEQTSKKKKAATEKSKEKAIKIDNKKQTNLKKDNVNKHIKEKADSLADIAITNNKNLNDMSARKNKMTKNSNSKNVSQELSNQKEDSKEQIENEEEAYEADNFQEEAESQIARKINTSKNSKKNNTKNENSRISQKSKANKSSISNNNNNGQAEAEAEENEYRFDDNDNLSVSANKQNRIMNENKNEDAEDKAYNDFENNSEDQKENSESRISLMTNELCGLEKSSINQENLNEIKNNLNPDLNKNSNNNKTRPASSKKIGGIGKKQANNTGYTSSIKYSFNPKFISDPKNFKSENNLLNKKITKNTGQNNNTNNKLNSTSKAKGNSSTTTKNNQISKTLLTRNSNNKNNSRSPNFDISTGNGFKSSLNQEINKVINQLEKSEASPPRKLISTTNKRNNSAIKNTNNPNKNNASNVDNTFDDNNNTNNYKNNNSFINNNNENSQIENNNKININNNNLFYESNNNFGGLNNENNFDDEQKQQSQFIRESRTQSQRPFSSKISGSMSKSKINKALSSMQKLEKEKDDYFKNLKKIKSNYESFNNNKNKKSLAKKTDNKNEVVNLKNKIPLSYENIDENKELVRLLLKNPKSMTIEEKIYINSLDDKEFKRLIEYLKVKSRELQWRGNDLGSGHYNELFIKIDRDTERYLNDRFTKLKNFLKLNFNNNQAVEYLKQAELQEEAKSRAEKLRLEAKFDGVEINNNLQEVYDENKVEEDNLKIDKFVKKSRDIIKELESFKTIVVDHKTQMQLEKINYQNNVIYRDLDEKINFFREDVKKMQEIKSKKSADTESDFLRKIEDFKLKNKNLYENFGNELAQTSIINKIRQYCIKMRINSINLLHSLNNIYVPNDEVDLNTVKKNLIKFSILSEEEAEFFVRTILDYKNESVKAEFFVCLIDSQFTEKKTEEGYKGNMDGDNNDNRLIEDLYKDEEEELLEMYNNDDDYDYFNIDLDQEKRLLEKKKRIIESKNIDDYAMVMKRKAALLVQKQYRKHCAYKKLKVYKASKIMLINRIIRSVRKFLNKIQQERNNAVHKIQFLMKTNLDNQKIYKNLKSNSKNWLKQNDASRTFAATVIQRYWRAYMFEMLDLFYDEDEKRNSVLANSKKKRGIDKSLVGLSKTKLCFICKFERVTHLCRSCANNLYCESCFNKFHFKGSKRNHMYMKLKEIIAEEKKKKIEHLKNNQLFLDEAAFIKEYLDKKGMDLYDHLKKWDFQKNGTIKFRNFKDSISEKFFNFDRTVRSKLLEFCLKYIEDDYVGNNDDKFIDYEKMCGDLI